MDPWYYRGAMGYLKRNIRKPIKPLGQSLIGLIGKTMAHMQGVMGSNPSKVFF